MLNKTKKNLLVAALALVVVGSVAIKPAMAYFTDTVSATKRVQISVGADVPETHEEVAGMQKKISIANTGSYDLYIRVKAVYSSNYKAVVNASSDSKWSLGEDGYYYYSDIVKAKTADTVSATNNLILDISLAEGAKVTDQDFNVIIVQEATKVLYDADGTPYADWNYVIGSEKLPVQSDDETADDATDNANNQNQEVEE